MRARESCKTLHDNYRDCLVCVCTFPLSTLKVTTSCPFLQGREREDEQGIECTKASGTLSTSIELPLMKTREVTFPCSLRRYITLTLTLTHVLCNQTQLIRHTQICRLCVKLQRERRRRRRNCPPKLRRQRTTAVNQSVGEQDREDSSGGSALLFSWTIRKEGKGR